MSAREERRSARCCTAPPLMRCIGTARSPRPPSPALLVARRRAGSGPLITSAPALVSPQCRARKEANPTLTPPCCRREQGSTPAGADVLASDELEVCEIDCD